MTDQVTKIATIAYGEVGVHETFSNGHWVNDSKYNKWYGPIPGYDRNGYDYPYCAAFVSWAADQAGLKTLYPKTAGCATAVAWFKNKSRFSEYPALGAQIFFGEGGGSHTGFVVGFDADHVYTVEANTNATGGAEGDGVYEKTRVRRDDYVYGYGYPEFAEGIVTADPSKKGVKGFTYKASASISKPAPPKTPTKPSAPSKTSAPAKPKPPAFPGRHFFGPGANNGYVTQLGKQLVKKGFGRYYQSGPGPRWSNADRLNLAAFQRSQGWSGQDADGYPGPETWRRLFS